MRTLAQDFKFAQRVLRKSPGFTTIAILTLAIGIALNASIFSLASAWLLRRPPVHDPDTIVAVCSTNPQRGNLSDIARLSVPDYFAIRAANHSFESMTAASEWDSANLNVGGEPEQMRTADVSSNYFSLLGVAPALGRTFADGEDQKGRNHVIILSHKVWESKFGSDPNIIGRAVRVDSESSTVIGVMPASFSLMGFPVQIWRPLVIADADQTESAHKNRFLLVFARLKSGVTLAQARRELSVIQQQAQHDFPDTEKGWGLSARLLPDFLSYAFGVRAAMVIMMFAVGFIMMIACANIAGLLLARATTRKKEMAIRIALGAGRLRVIRQLLTEGLLITLAGGVLGLAMSFWGVDFLRANINFNDAVSAVSYRVDANVVIYTALISIVSALLFSVAPAWQASKTDVNTGLKDESRNASSGRSRLRSVLVTAEIALALFLLSGTGFLIFSIVNMLHQYPGFTAAQVLTANVGLDDVRYHQPAQQLAFFRNVVRRLEKLPGVDSAAATSDLPCSDVGQVAFRIQGQPEPPVNAKPTTHDYVISRGYFRTARIPLVRGREFTDADNADAPRVVLVDTAFAQQYLKNMDPLGKVIGLEVGDSAGPEWAQIIGVVGNVKNWIESDRAEPFVYEADAQRPQSNMSLMVRTTGNPDALAPELRRAVWAEDSDQPVAQLMTMPDVLRHETAGDVLFSKMLAAFALVALILSAIGIYGIVAFSVAQRTREIGIRMALGAEKLDVVRMVLGEGMKLALIGGGIGFIASLALPKALEALIQNFHIHAMWIYAVVPLAIAAVAILATYIPARRATRVDPMVALRYE
jgi:putative ABC transport system permease protein